jgi:hypothetical protein
MTSRRPLPTLHRSTRVAVLTIAAWLAACASLPNDAPVVEQLDDQTGLTIARLGKPLELYRENFRKDALGKFAFLGPFETNQMGRRELYLWLALPLEDTASHVKPVFTVNGTALELPEAGRAPDAAGLQSTPYKIPMSWIATFYYRLDSAAVARLGEARTLRIQVTEDTKSGPLRTAYLLELGDDPRLREFAARQ